MWQAGEGVIGTEVLNWYRFDTRNHSDDGYIDGFAVDIVKSIIEGAADAQWIFDSLVERTSSGTQLSCSLMNYTTFDGVNTTTGQRRVPRDFHASVAVARREIPLDIQSALARAGSWGVRFLIASKPATTSETLAIIFETDPGLDEASLEDHDASAYFDAGIDWEQLWPNELGLTPVDDFSVLADLGDDLKSAARARVVLHSNFPSSLLPAAARSENSAIRAAAARSPHASEELLRSLAMDSDVHVRQGVTINPLSSDEIRVIAALTP